MPPSITTDTITIPFADGPTEVHKDVVAKWLRGTNAHLGDRRPIDVIRQGRLSEVVAAIEAEKAGAFA